MSSNHLWDVWFFALHHQICILQGLEWIWRSKLISDKKIRSLSDSRYTVFVDFPCVLSYHSLYITYVKDITVTVSVLIHVTPHYICDFFRDLCYRHENMQAYLCPNSYMILRNHLICWLINTFPWFYYVDGLSDETFLARQYKSTTNLASLDIQLVLWTYRIKPV